ncbi:MAG: TonB-dependent receptor [Burkholderiales bacterium]
MPLLPLPARRPLLRHSIARRRWPLRPLAAALLAHTAIAQAQDADGAPSAPPTAQPVQLERVEIRGTRSETEQRRQSTASKIIIGRDEIEKYGDSNVADVLKRLPGVTVGGTPGRGGDIRMRGLSGGYTQILINGERIPEGFSLDALAPEQIERIEVLRAPSAEFGAQAIGGTLNIVLRGGVTRPRRDTLVLASAFEGGRPKPSVGWARSDKQGDLSYDLSANLGRHSWLSRNTTRTVSQFGAQPVVDRSEQYASRSHMETANASGVLQYRLGAGESVSLTPYFAYSQARNWAHSEVTPDTATTFAATRTPFTWYWGTARATARWQLRPAEGAKLDAKFSGHYSGWGNATQRDEFGPASAGLPLTRELDGTGRTRDRGFNTSGKYSRQLDNGHEPAAGWDLDLSQRGEQQATLDQVYAPVPNTDPRSQTLGTRRLISALWAQDEWTLTPQWTLQAGLRWERIATRSGWVDDTGQPAAASQHSSVATPLLHALWRPDADSRDQVRLSLTRSYKAPTAAQLAARRSISRNVPTDQTNSPSTPDYIGNPLLRPELATGLDAAYEHYLGSGGMVSVGVFHRQIQNLIRTVTTPTAQAVPWASAPRYTSQPVNLASATTSGIELEAKVRLSELAPAAAPVDVRGNLSLFRSRVASVPGPNNTLDRQPGYTANVGADYKLRSLPLSLGGNLNFTPGYTTRTSAEYSSQTGVRRALDAYGQWTFSPTASLRVSANNLLPLHATSSSSFIGPGGSESTWTDAPTVTVLTVRLELKI